MELRTQLLQTLAAKDSRMALDFLRASRLPDTGKLFGGKGSSPDFEQRFRDAVGRPHSGKRSAARRCRSPRRASSKGSIIRSMKSGRTC